MSLSKAAIPLLYKKLYKIAQNKNISIKERTEELYNYLDILFNEATKDEKLEFSTLFTKMAYTGRRFSFPSDLSFYMHYFRRAMEGRKAVSISAEDLMIVAVKVISRSIEQIWQEPISEELQKVNALPWPIDFRPREIKAFYAHIRAVVLEIDPDKKILLFKDEDGDGELLTCLYGIAERNEIFDNNILLISNIIGLPANVSMIDVELDSKGIYRPAAFVLEPDFLIDVSAIAEAFRDRKGNPWNYLLRKFLPFQTSGPLMLGNIANFFLDALMTDPEITYAELKSKIFQLNPIGFCLLEDKVIIEILKKSQRHYMTLKEMVKSGFESQGIHPNNTYLEPTFLSSKYGIQGRLDIFQAADKDNRGAIIELKSGKVYKPNTYGLSGAHYMQTLLYDLLINSTFGKIKSTNYILYSALDRDQLRFAPTSKNHQYEGLQIRNQLYLIERLMGNIRASEPELLHQCTRFFNKLAPSNFPLASNFEQRDLHWFFTVFSHLSPLYKKYFGAYAGFIAREHILAKSGVQKKESGNGQAALWLERLEDKKEAFSIINHLLLVENHTDTEDPILIFHHSEETHELSNFRRGDIAIIYPENKDRSPLSNQLFKGTIVMMEKGVVAVRLRFRQFNATFFDQYKYWNIEHDMLDSGYVSTYRSLFSFMDAPEDKRNLVMGIQPPEDPIALTISKNHEMTEEQHDILTKALAARAYFMIWGPPGTGKTSFMLKEIISRRLTQSKDSMLVLAYTNRAVDEICEAISSIGPRAAKSYLRIGSSYSTSEAYRDRLLHTHVAEKSSRQEIIELLENHRIIVATLASYLNKTDLYSIKKFDLAIIDEASQISEPMLVGILPQFEKFILIGDHRQLPAVVQQAEEDTQVIDEDLQNIGLHNLRNSLFERLYRNAQQNGWDHAYDILSHQGRMHEDIMAFPNKYFYKNQLHILPNSIPYHEQQQKPLNRPLPKDTLYPRLAKQRVLFLDTPADNDQLNIKTNQYEAQTAIELVKTLSQSLADEGKAITAKSIGIITPYRAQIAAIKQLLEHELPDINALITIDTVERYQGGARDIIIVSLCSNELSQLKLLSTLSEEGIDRKLNVAITRAKEQLIFLGNVEILRQSKVYANLIDFLDV